MDRRVPPPSFTGLPPWLPQRPELWQTWPGAHLPDAAHPFGTEYVGHDRVPQYPGGTTCSMLGEREPYFPMGWSLALLILTAILLYILWPLYVLRHLIRKSVYGDDERFQTNHEAYRAKMGAAAKGKSEMEEEEEE
ncbi:hypothetical protein N0V87_003661 [Didymella glomerata]|uniref:Uncharacterized protein n=1 Tax=Didymella glomerata TaxID=749621 RepID=A0A9W8X1U1_9PLEO|nr:hypothetical protein N0V87_003661 [Didymella glomerata]